MVLSFGRRLMDEAGDSDASSGSPLQVEKSTSQAAPAASPMAPSSGMSDDEFQAAKNAAIEQAKSESGNASVALDGTVTHEKPKEKKTRTPRAAKAVVPVAPVADSASDSESGGESPEVARKVSKSVYDQLTDAYGMSEEEAADFDDDNDAIRFMDRIDKRQSSTLKAARAKPVAPEQPQFESPKSRTVAGPVDPMQREIDRSRGVESQAAGSMELSPEEYVEHLRESTVGVLKKANYDDDVVGVFEKLMEHMVFQDDHIRKLVAHVSGLNQHRRHVEDAGVRNDGENFLRIMDTVIDDKRLFGSPDKRTPEQWEKIEEVYGIVNHLRGRRADKSLTNALVTRAASMALEGNVRTKGQRVTDQSRMKMASPQSRTEATRPTPGSFAMSDPASNPVIQAKIRELRAANR